jgi:hypothetical protein
MLTSPLHPHVLYIFMAALTPNLYVSFIPTSLIPISDSELWILQHRPSKLAVERKNHMIKLIHAYI